MPGPLSKLIKPLLEALKGAPKVPRLSPADISAKKFLAGKGALQVKPKSTRTLAQLKREQQAAEMHAQRPGRKYANVKLAAMSDELARIAGVRIQTQLTKESISGALRASAKVQRFLRGPKPKLKVQPKKPSTAGKWGRAGLIGAGLGVGGTALAGSSILRRHHEMQMGQQIPLHYRPE